MLANTRLDYCKFNYNFIRKYVSIRKTPAKQSENNLDLSKKE